jgi:hypothetical protein
LGNGGQQEMVGSAHPTGALFFYDKRRAAGNGGLQVHCFFCQTLRSRKWWAVPTLRFNRFFVMLSAAQHLAWREAAIACGSFRMTEKLTTLSLVWRK